MTKQLSAWREDKTYAHVVPFGIFMVFTMLFQFVGQSDFWLWEHDDAPWWRQYPEQLFYPLQALVCGAALLFFWKHYDFRWSRKVWMGAVAGVVGIGFWLLPTTLYDYWRMTGEPEGFWGTMSGLAPRTEGFDPGVFESGAAFWSSLILRVFRAVVIVALVEEIFWRGFLMRFLLKMDGNYWRVPFGKASWITFLVITGLFVAVHQPIDRPMAFIYGSITYGVAVYTRSLLACVVMHGVANATMAAYIMAYGKFGLW